MFNTERILKDISINTTKKLVEYGCNKILIELGFQIGAYSNDIIYNDHNNKLIDTYITGGSNEILEHIQKELNTRLDTEVHRMLINKQMTKMVEFIRDKITENVDALIHDKIDYLINQKYVKVIEEEVDRRIMDDPIIKAAMIKKL